MTQSYVEPSQEKKTLMDIDGANTASIMKQLAGAKLSQDQKNKVMSDPHFLDIVILESKVSSLQSFVTAPNRLQSTSSNIKFNIEKFENVQRDLTAAEKKIRYSGEFRLLEDEKNKWVTEKEGLSGKIRKLVEDKDKAVQQLFEMIAKDESPAKIEAIINSLNKTHETLSKEVEKLNINIDSVQKKLDTLDVTVAKEVGMKIEGEVTEAAPTVRKTSGT